MTEEHKPKKTAAEAAAAGGGRYIPKPEARDLTDFGGGKNEKLAAPASGDLIPDMAAVLSAEDMLTTERAMKVYNIGLSVEQFLQTPVGKELLSYAEQDERDFAVTALDKNDLDHGAVKTAFKRAQAAHYLIGWIKEKLDLAKQATTVMRLEDENDQEGQP